MPRGGRKFECNITNSGGVVKPDIRDSEKSLNIGWQVKMRIQEIQEPLLVRDDLNYREKWQKKRAAKMAALFIQLV